MNVNNMKVLRSIRSNRKTQSFGEAKACATQYADGRIQVFPMPPNGTCPVGQKNLYKDILGMKGHNGEDWAVWRGEPLYFPVFIDGAKWRAKTEIDSAGGIGVNIISINPVQLEGYYGHIKFKFWHLQKPLVLDDQEVKPGDLIGLCDSTGLSGGDHLHWSMKKCYPTGVPLDRNNGYYGAMDFGPWFENMFVFDFLKLQSVEVQVKEAQLTLIQLLNKIIFLFQEQIRAFSKKVGEGFGAFIKNIQK